MGLDVTGRYRYPPPRPEWLALGEAEPAIDAGRTIVDAHHHLWVEGGEAYLLDELLEDTDGGHNVAATVFVQAHYGYRTSGPAHLAPVGESEKVAQMSAKARRMGARTAVAAAIVAHGDLTLGDALEDVLDAHAAVADGRLRGIRHSVSRDPHFPDGIVIRPAPEGLLASPAYRAGLLRLAGRNLVFEAMLYHCQIPELTAVAAAFPDLTIVLDHMGCVLGVGPYQGRERETFLHWRDMMTALAAQDNVRVKLGGLGMIVCGARWHERALPPHSSELAEAWRPYIETCIEAFGPQRAMFESNYPVDYWGADYAVLWNAFKRLTRSASPDEKAALYAGTAARFYGLEHLLR